MIKLELNHVRFKQFLHASVGKWEKSIHLYHDINILKMLYNLLLLKLCPHHIVQMLMREAEWQKLLESDLYYKVKNV